MENLKHYQRGAIGVRTAFMLPVLLLLIVPISNYYQLNKTITEWQVQEADNHLAVLRTLRNFVANDLSILVNDQAYLSEQEPLFAPLANIDVDIDGRLNEWQTVVPRRFQENELLKGTGDNLSLEFSARLKQSEDSLYLFLDMIDDQVVYREISNISIHRNDHIRLAMVDKDGLFNRYTLATQQPGTIYGRVVSTGGRSLRREPKIEGVWRATDNGYQVEIKIDQGLASGAMAINVADVDSTTNREISHIIGTSPGDQPDELSPILGPAPGLNELFANLELSNIAFEDLHGNLLAKRGAMTSGQTHTQALIVDGVNYGNFISHIDQTRHQVFLDSMLRQIYVLSAIVLTLGLLLSFWLARGQMARIKQLGLALDSMVDEQGRVQGALSGASGNDVIGDLSQRFADITQRLQQYNEYLELLSRRLAHELRTPVSVVRSSLENLANNVDERNLKYVQRANNGVARLTNILNSMSEASRLEQTLDKEEVVVFDLGKVIEGCFEGYEQAFPSQAFELILESHETKVTGIPELFAQMLDKLIDNASQFSESGQPVILRLSTEGDHALVRVSNSGASLPSTMSQDLFDPMISVRENRASEDSHLGMGLYVAKLIARFHGGDVYLKNREDREGVVATIEVPLLRLTSKLA